MLNFLFEFKQDELLKVSETQSITMDDVVILHYILNALCSQNTNKIVEDGRYYVWLKRSHILESLPILNISERQLSNILHKLEDMGLIKTKQKMILGKGSKSFIGITPKLINCLNPKTETYSKIANYGDEKNCISRDVKNCTSDNKNIDDKNRKNISNTKVLDTEKGTKLNFYQKCVKAIEEYTDDEDLKSLLLQYLKIIVKTGSLHGNSVNWSKKLQWLKETGADIQSIKHMIQICIDRGYSGFFNPNNLGSNRTNNFLQSAACESNVNSIKMTEDEKAHQKEFQDKMRSEGKQIEF